MNIISITSIILLSIQTICTIGNIIFFFQARKHLRRLNGKATEKEFFELIKNNSKKSN